MVAGPIIWYLWLRISMTTRRTQAYRKIYRNWCYEHVYDTLFINKNNNTTNVIPKFRR